MAAPKKPKTQPPATVQNFPIVGIGASAGGLDAFKRLLAAIPESSGMAYVLVQHLDPSHESILPEILQRVTKIPVHEITEDIHLAPDHIYIIPSNKILSSTDGVLKLTPRDRKIINLSVDIFFTSIAHVHKEFAVGVVLSGTGSDGTLGLKAIKEYGGISIVQDSESAAYDSMPQSAVNEGVVDFILPPEEIPAQLLQINRAFKTSHFYKDEAELPKDDEAIFKQILLLLRQRSGVDFTYYKQPTFHRRIARRIAIAKRKNLADYLKFLRTDKAEQDALFQDVLIPVTSFFRDPKTFQTLCDTVFPVLFKNKSVDQPIRIWIAGCSTGEEAYSIAICLHEFLGEKLSDTKIQIFASDISEKSIKKARAGIYTKADVGKISATQLNNYFVKNNAGYEVNKLIRDMCVFAPHNFLKDPPFARIDLITCRNVLIYMDTFLQKKAFTNFHYALKENGFLLLGKSETTGASSDLFTQFSKQDKIYSRKHAPGRFMHVATERREESLVTKDRTKTKQETVHTDFRKSAEAIMISKSPASVVVNEQMDIVHIHGIITPFLESPQGKPTHNLIKMAREGLAFELRNAIHKATKEQATVTKENIPVRASGKQSLVTIEIIPLTDTVEPHYLIRFERKIIPVVQEEKKSSSGKINESKQLNEQLERELSQTREDMRSITEDMEAGNEELQSANEELQSSNEEMQSLNEELETSKEELQSSNEELLIVNQELLDKQEQLNASRFYSEAIVTTMREPLVVLDKSLRIKTANASFYKKFDVEEEETEDKLFYEIQNHQFDDTLLRALLEKVLPQKNRIEDFEINLRLPDKGDRVVLINARQVVNEKKAEQLILLAMEDITDRVHSEKILKESENRFKLAIKASGHIVFAQDENLKYIWIYNEHSDFKAEDILGKDDYELLEPETAKRLTTLKKEVLQSGTTIRSEVLMTINSEQSFYEIMVEAIKNETGKVTGITGVAMNITEKVIIRKQIEASENEQKKLASHLKLATDSANIGIWSLDIVSSKLEWSNIHKKMWGYDENREGLTYEDWHKVIVPEDKELTFQRIEESKLNHDIYEADYRITRANDGAIVWIKSTGQYYYDEFGVALTLTGISIDISEQKEAERKIKESEARSRAFVESNVVAVCFTHLESATIFEANAAYLNMLGYTRKDLKEGKINWLNYTPPEHHVNDQLAIEKARSMKISPPYEKEIMRTDGKRISVIKARAIINQDEIMSVFVDITERKSAEQKLKTFAQELEAKVKERTAELQTSNEELKQTNMQLDQFAHVASHDLQEPLRKILTFSLRLQDKHKDGLSQEIKTYLNKIEGASKRMATLIGDLLNYSRLLQHEKLFTQTDLNLTLKNILDDFELLIHEKKAEIKIAQLPTIDAIPLQMSQLFYNLINNALKFSKEDVPPVITITSRTLSEKEIQKNPALGKNVMESGVEPPSYIEILFNDNGIGFEQQYDKKIFIIFQRLHDNETFKGTGIGLALCKKIVENHNGEIFADAKENKGASFHIILPLTQPR